jgi:predicted transcriptional regulator
MHQHYDAMMRTTIDLPDDLHCIVSSLAVHTRRSLSLTAVELIRRGLASAAPTAASHEPIMVTSATTGLPVIRLPRVVTPEDVKALEDDT